MTFSLRIIAKEITNAMNACAQFVDASSQIPILKTVHIAIADGIAQFTATNTDQTIQFRAACAGEGIVAVDANALMAKVSTLRPNDPVEFDGDGKFVNVVQGRTKWKMPCLIEGDFPIQAAAPINVDPTPIGKEFMTALKQVHGVIDPAHTMFAVTGARIHDNRVFATDARRARAIDIPQTIPKSFTMPGKAIPKVIAVLPDGGELRATETQFSITSEFVTVTSRLTEGQFPEIEKIIAGFSDRLNAKATVDADDFLAAVRRAGAIRMSGEKSTAFLNMQLRFRSEEIEIVSRNLDGEEGFDAVRCEHEGPDADVGFVGNHLIDEVSSLAMGTFDIRHGDDRTPIILGREGNIRFLQARDFR